MRTLGIDYAYPGRFWHNPREDEDDSWEHGLEPDGNNPRAVIRPRNRSSADTGGNKSTNWPEDVVSGLLLKMDGNDIPEDVVETDDNTTIFWV